MNTETTEQVPADNRWKPLTVIQRRVLGVLVEKAKTTPDAYPLTLNALTNGCNQKSNRQPKMECETHEVEEGLDELRELGVVTEIWGSGRVPKYRHDAYDWLGVDKQEMAVMVELLLRGEQTVGELRGRAARMEPIADLAALQPLLVSLQERGLVISLTPTGRGQVVTHGLYQEAEQAVIQNQFEGMSAKPVAQLEQAPETVQIAPPRTAVTLDMYSELQVELAEVEAEVSRLRARIEQLEAALPRDPGSQP
ncbi:MAG: DUF480 domain-containing protein [Planctomycetaceae bacterium]|nr:DUF480 domain-containing protein [Planctomycetaceae bacterium]